jgi:hypothetical protein
MRSFILILMLLTLNAFAFPIGYHTVEIYDAFNANIAADAVQTANIATNSSDIATNVVGITKLGQVKKNVIVYDLNITVPLAPSSTVTFPLQKIPANSIVSNVFYEVQTQLVSTNSATVAFTCGSTTLDTAAALEGVAANTIAAGDIVIQTIGGHKNVGAECTPTITIGAQALGVASGRIRWFVEYVTRY